MYRIRSLFIVASLFTTAAQWAQTHPIQNGPIHEAFLTPNQGALVLSAVSSQPPPPLVEDLPPQIDPQADWIRGYWGWSPEEKSFVWVSGIERGSPPDHLWFHGFWKYFNEGWTWIPGFWSREQYKQIAFIEIPPPDPLDEDPGIPPSQEHFWVSGYWYYHPQEQNYEWLSGKWEPFDPDWILVPAHYIWHPDGYIFIPSYWDWPINLLGKVYQGARIEQAKAFHPHTLIEIDELLRHYFLNYPDYLNYAHHHYHYHPDFWRLFLHTPPWWRWNSWWCFNWYNQWSLWWWYVHPGYPQPKWLKAEISDRMPAPSMAFVKAFQRVQPPFIITENGPVNARKVIDAILEVNQRGKEFTEKLRPILSADPQMLQEVRSLFLPPPFENKILFPLGSYASLRQISEEQIRQPFVGMPKSKQRQFFVKVPSKPVLPNNIQAIKKSKPTEESPLYKPSKLPKPTITPYIKDTYPIVIPLDPHNPPNTHRKIEPFIPYKNSTEGSDFNEY
jgi:hypothetical protein